MSKKYIKSPLNYTGGKHKLLSQIIPLFPSDINTFVDMFGGGFNVGVNVDAKNIVYNDNESAVVSLLEDLYVLGSDKSLPILKQTISKYQLSKTNEEGFKQIRDDYNNGDNSWDMFYAMLTNAFNNQIRFNKNGGYNIPFGRNRSSFNPSLEKRFVEFVDTLSKKSVVFLSSDFRDIKVCELDGGDFVYCDPPYLITTASYNESGGWTEKDEKDLYNLLDMLNSKGIKFALSNVFESKGKSNDMLKEWSKKYNINYLNANYGNCNYQVKDRTSKDIEVLITNY